MMKKALKRVVFALVLIMIFAAPLWAVDKLGPRLITVTGEAEVQVAPNQAMLTLGVETLDKDLGIAKRENDERVKRVLDLAKKYGVAPGHVRVEHISIEPRYYDGETREDFIGYRVRKTIVLTVRNLSKFDDLLNSALEAGANYVYGVQFRTTKLRQYRNQARALALKAAKEKAKNMAKELGQKAGRPYTIVEERYEKGMAPNVIQGAGDSSEGADKSIALGQISVNARVRVSFELR
jgi:uncharacterized protein YggE